MQLILPQNFTVVNGIFKQIQMQVKKVSEFHAFMEPLKAVTTALRTCAAPSCRRRALSPLCRPEHSEDTP